MKLPAWTCSRFTSPANVSAWFPCRRIHTLQRSKNGYRLISGLRVLRAWQDGTFICLDCPHEDLSFWLSYLDMDRDYQAVIASIDRENSYLTAAAMSGAGIRILRQDPWEMIITFVISQQKTIPNIRQLVEALSSRYGTAPGGWTRPGERRCPGKRRCPWRKEMPREGCLPAGLLLSCPQPALSCFPGRFNGA